MELHFFSPTFQRGVNRENLTIIISSSSSSSRPSNIIIYPLYIGFYNYIPETNHVSKVCTVAAVL